MHVSLPVSVNISMDTCGRLSPIQSRAGRRAAPAVSPPLRAAAAGHQNAAPRCARPHMAGKLRGFTPLAKAVAHCGVLPGWRCCWSRISVIEVVIKVVVEASVHNVPLVHFLMPSADIEGILHHTSIRVASQQGGRNWGRQRSKTRARSRAPKLSSPISSII